MAGLVSSLLLIIVQYVVLDCAKQTIEYMWVHVYQPYGIQMCRGLCRDSPDTFYYIQEDLACHQTSVNYTADFIKLSPQDCLTEEKSTTLESACAFQRGLDVCHREDGETRQEIPDGQQTLATDRKPQQSTDAVRSPCKRQPELTTEATHSGDVKVDQCKCGIHLIDALENRKPDVVKSILSRGNTNINCRDRSARTLVMFAVFFRQVPVFDYLVSQSCDLTAVDKSKNNVLHFACMGGNVDIVKKLLDSDKCDIDSKNGHGRTPIIWAVYYSHREVFHLLEEKGCNLRAVDVFRYNILELACRNGLVDLVQYILSLNIFSIDVKGFQGRTPVMAAAMRGKTGVVRFLVGRGCILTVADDNENNILHVACMRWRNVDVVKYLMALRDCKGMEKAKNKKGETPAQIAKKKYDSRLVQLFKGKE